MKKHTNLITYAAKHKAARCGLTILLFCVLCVLMQPQPACAAENSGAETALLETSSDEGAAEATDAWALSEAAGGEAQENTERVQTEETADETETVSDEPEAAEDDTGEADEAAEEETPEETVVPEAVTGLHTTCQSDTKVLLEWTASEGAARYRVYRRTGSGAYEKLGEVKKTKYTDKTIVFGETYRYKIIPVSAAGVKGKGTAITLPHTQAVNILTQKYTFKQMETDMKELAKAYSDYCELTVIGTSVEGRAIYDFAIGNPDASRSLLVVSTLHAREYICSAVLMREIEYYLRNYNKKISGSKPADVLSDMQIHYVVMANPDGVTISQTSYARWKANSRGVDLNRNFPAVKFVVGGTKGAQGYSGPKALSEPESKAVATLTKQLKKKQGLLGVVNYHAMGQIIFGDCSAGKLKTATTTMYLIARSLTGYSSASGYSSGSSSSGGQYREYVMDILELPSITIEVGYTSAPCSYLEYESAFQKNKLVVLKIAEAL